MNQNSASSSLQPDSDECQAAERKLCRFFRSFGLDARAHRDRLIDPYLDRARMFWRPHSGSDFGALAVQEAKAHLEAWFAFLIGEHLEDRASAIMTGRAAYLMCNGPSLWADELLAPAEKLPEAFKEALTESVPSSLPPSELGEMRHQPYEAWSPTAFVARTLPSSGSFFQGLSWRSTETTR